MAKVRGTKGADFIHRAGDGLIAPGGKKNLLGVTKGNDTVLGLGGNDLLYGDKGNDRLDGGKGVDKLFGGLGNDTYLVNSLQDKVTERTGGASGGTDTVRASVNFTLGANLENLVLTGSGNLTGNGNGLANVITGNGGSNSLSGRVGNDTISGGGGEDTLLGGAGQDSLSGGIGNDLLDGGSEADAMIGGAGNDTYIVDDASDALTELAGEGIDLIQTSLSSFTLGVEVENLTFTGAGNFTGTGNTLANAITGGTGDDTLNGGDGADTLTGGAGNDSLTGGVGTDALIGGAGNDSYVIDDAGDIVTEAVGEGTDLVQTSLASLTLATNVENLTYTGSGNFAGTGNALANAITGGVGNDTLDGGAGADTLTGGAGNDQYVVDAAGDVVVEASGGGTDTILTGLASYTLGAEVENLTYTGTGDFTGLGNLLANVINGAGGNDMLSGNDGNDSLNGGAGNDSLLGGAGDDLLAGGDGDDIYLAVDLGDIIVEDEDEGTDTVETTLGSFTLGANLENLTFTGSGDFSGLGNTLDNLLTGGDGNDTLDGDEGADTLIGGAGNDLFLVDDVGDVVTEAASEGTDTIETTLSTLTLAANVENLTYTGSGAFAGTGNALDNLLTGGGGNDTLDGGAGSDTLVGGLGDDVYLVDDAADLVTEAASAGTDTLQTTLDSLTLGANLENLTYLGTGDFEGTGNTLANVITGAGGSDTLDGDAGNDTLIGGLGDDLYIVDSVDDLVTEGLAGGTDEIQTALTSFGLGANLENLTYTGSGDFSGTGNILANVITGDGGNDTLDGEAGNDTLIGGAGNDLYIVDSLDDMVTEGLAAGTDEIWTALGSYALGANIENLSYVGSGDFNGTGNTLANVISGDSGNDTLDGEAGNDTLIGGAGDDLYVVDALDDVVTEALAGGSDEIWTALGSYTLGSHLENLTYTGSGDFAGTGNTLGNVIEGGAGNDTLDGAAGADTLVGGLGDDVYIVDDAGDVVSEALNSGGDLVETTLASYVLGLNVENLTYLGTGSFAGTGNALANVITGGDLADTLDGGAGADTLVGGLGDDVYVLDDAGDSVTELLNEGTDLVQTTLSSLTLAANLENLTYTGIGNFAGTGNTLANLITGAGGNDTLNGGDGNDTLNGGAGTNTLTGGAGIDSFLFDTLAAVTTITDFSTTDDVLGFDASALNLGDGDGIIDSVVTLTTFLDLWNSDDEIVFVNSLLPSLGVGDLVTFLNLHLGLESLGDTQLMVLNDGTSTAIYSHVADGVLGITASDLTLVATLDGVTGLTAGAFDFL